MPKTPDGVRGAIITGWGSALPPKILTNYDLEQMFETDADWIVDRTGIESRHVGGSTVALSVESGRKAIIMAGIDPLSIDAVVLATTTPDRVVPASAPAIQHELGLKCGAFDVNAACSGFMYALVTAHGLIALGAEKVLCIGTDTLARITDWTDRNTAILFADGSGAVVLERTTGPGQLLGWDIDSDGAAERFLYAEVGGKLQMEGKEIFRRAVRAMVDSATKSLAHAGVSADEISLVVPHQANIRIIQAAMERLNIPMSKASTVLHFTGNTSSASIPLAMVDALDANRVQTGDLVLLVGFGAGMTAASSVLQWGGPRP